MMDEDHGGYHRRRAEKEIDLALAASNLTAARAHFTLARMHADKLRALTPAGEMEPLIHM